MSFFDTIRKKIGHDNYAVLVKTAETEVALSVQMPLIDSNHKPKYYNQRNVLSELLPQCESFEQHGLKIFPTDLVNILFRCKLLFAAKTPDEFRQRSGDAWGLFQSPSERIVWDERTDNIDTLIDRHISELEADLQHRTLLSGINSFASIRNLTALEVFLEQLFTKLGYPFVCFIDDKQLIERHRNLEPHRPAYDQVAASEFFSAPSIGFRISGSRQYCFWNSVMWLRSFLNLLRIASFTHPGQIEFGIRDVKMTAPTFPVFLGERAQGSYQWNEDTKESWEKIPDGCLFLSFGYRGLTSAWLDMRNFDRIEEFMLHNRVILDSLKNPWTRKSLRDVAPTLDILSSATQTPDLGAKNHIDLLFS